MANDSLAARKIINRLTRGALASPAVLIAGGAFVATPVVMSEFQHAEAQTIPTPSGPSITDLPEVNQCTAGPACVPGGGKEFNPEGVGAAAFATFVINSGNEAFSSADKPRTSLFGEVDRTRAEIIRDDVSQTVNSVDERATTVSRLVMFSGPGGDHAAMVKIEELDNLSAIPGVTTYRGFTADSIFGTPEMRMPGNLMPVKINFDYQREERAVFATIGAAAAISTSGASTGLEVILTGAAGYYVGDRAPDTWNTLDGLNPFDLANTYEEAEVNERGYVHIYPNQYKTIATPDGKCTIANVERADNAKAGLVWFSENLRSCLWLDPFMVNGDTRYQDSSMEVRVSGMSDNTLEYRMGDSARNDVDAARMFTVKFNTNHDWGYTPPAPAPDGAAPVLVPAAPPVQYSTNAFFSNWAENGGCEELTDNTPRQTDFEQNFCFEGQSILSFTNKFGRGVGATNTLQDLLEFRSIPGEGLQWAPAYMNTSAYSARTLDAANTGVIVDGTRMTLAAFLDSEHATVDGKRISLEKFVELADAQLGKLWNANHAHIERQLEVGRVSGTIAKAEIDWDATEALAGDDSFVVNFTVGGATKSLTVELNDRNGVVDYSFTDGANVTESSNIENFITKLGIRGWGEDGLGEWRTSGEEGGLQQLKKDFRAGRPAAEPAPAAGAAPAAPASPGAAPQPSEPATGATPATPATPPSATPVQPTKADGAFNYNNGTATITTAAMHGATPMPVIRIGTFCVDLNQPSSADQNAAVAFINNCRPSRQTPGRPEQETMVTMKGQRVDLWTRPMAA